MARNVPPPQPPPNAGPSATPPAIAGYRPNPVQLIFHVGRTSRLTGALLGDPRISIFRKLFFILAIAALVLALLLPETVGAILENVLPFVGPILGLPGDLALDWVAATVIGFNLLRIFPAEVVSEHYERLFRVAPATQSRPVPPNQPRPSTPR